MLKSDFERQNTIFCASSNVKIGFWCQNTISSFVSNVIIGLWMSKFDIRPHSECQNKILKVKIQHSAEFECPNRILIVKIWYLTLIRMSKYDCECQYAIFFLSLNVKIWLWMSKYDIRHCFECQNRIFECPYNAFGLILRLRYSALIWMSW